MQRVYVMHARISCRNLIKIGRSFDPYKRAQSLDKEVERAAKWFRVHAQSWTKWAVAHQTEPMNIHMAGNVEGTALSLFGIEATPFLGREIFERDSGFCGPITNSGPLTVENAIQCVTEAISIERRSNHEAG